MHGCASAGSPRPRTIGLGSGATDGTQFVVYTVDAADIEARVGIESLMAVAKDRISTRMEVVTKRFNDKKAALAASAPADGQPQTAVRGNMAKVPLPPDFFS